MTIKPRLYSGMQPSSGSLHLGNYIGAIQQWRAMQEEYDAFFSIVDLHAITVPQDPRTLREQVRTVAAQYIAAGIDPSRSCLYVQSHVPAHAQLAWVLSTITGFGEAGRMTQFKDKSARQGADAASVGLFTYPILMAADILLFDTTAVPVGDDQKQHVELTRDLATRFNARYGETFTVPTPVIQGEAARIYDLQEPTAKMSKSAATDKGLLSLLDEPARLAKKIRSAVTDMEGVVRADRAEKPGVTNLLAILSSISGRPVAELEVEFAGQQYGTFKAAVADAVVAEVEPIRDRALALLADPAELDRILAANAARASEVAEATLDRAYRAIGLR
jgi:tryptophanyl-tRNA synthetase